MDGERVGTYERMKNMRWKHLILVFLISAPAAGAAPEAPHSAPKHGDLLLTEPANLLEGAKWLYSIDGGKTFSDKPVDIPTEKTVAFRARTVFTVDDPSQFVVLELTHGLTRKCEISLTLNGRAIKGPLEGMFYRTIPAIDAKWLKKGSNTLQADATVPNKSSRRREAKDIKFTLEMSLAALEPRHLRFQTGPMLGAIGEDYFTVTCRTNMPAKVTLERHPEGSSQKWGLLGPGEQIATSPPGLIHRLRVRTPAGPQHGEYILLAECGNCACRMSVNVPAFPDNGLRFVALGDSRSRPEEWKKVAKAVLDRAPHLVLFSGDMVSNGSDDWQWDNEFFHPAAELLGKIPQYAVIGNHEKNAPLYNELFYTPSKDGRSRNWAQEIASVLLIGIDGRKDWSSGSANARWLEKTLKGSKAKFIFLASHYPAWTSAGHGKLDEAGKPRETAVRQGQQVIMPLLEKYDATAMIAGHDHIYERSEPPGGVTMIISGGAGAPLYRKSETAEKQNPYSKVFHSKLHYCLFRVRGDTCTMEARTPGHEVLDGRTWRARAVK
jgi:hypothetical protein